MPTLSFRVDPETLSESNNNQETVEALNTMLMDSDRALAYLGKRGISLETANDLNFGYLPFQTESPNLHVSDLSIDNWMRGRLIIPIHDVHGKVVALAGRDLTGTAKCKYWHPSYKKRLCFYNLNRSKESIWRMKASIIVEGFMHVAMLWQHGVRNTVALQSAALQVEKANILSRYCETAIVIPDNDQAGEESFKAISKLLRDDPYKFTVKAVRIPKEYNDIDEFIHDDPTLSKRYIDALKVPWVKRTNKVIDTIRLSNIVDSATSSVLSISKRNQRT